MFLVFSTHELRHLSWSFLKLRKNLWVKKLFPVFHTQFCGKKEEYDEKVTSNMISSIY